MNYLNIIGLNFTELNLRGIKDAETDFCFFFTQISIKDIKYRFSNIADLNLPQFLLEPKFLQNNEV